MNGKKCNELAVAYLRGIGGEVRKKATSKYGKKAPIEAVASMDMAPGELGDDELAELLAQVDEAGAGLGDMEMDEGEDETVRRRRA